MVASVYLKHGHANQFVSIYTADGVPVETKAKLPRGASRVDGPVPDADDAKTQEEPAMRNDNGQASTPPLGAKKMVGNQHRSAKPARSQPASKSVQWNMYASKLFYKEETRMALAAAILAPISW